MTGLGRSPPRSKKESSDAGEQAEESEAALPHPLVDAVDQPNEPEKVTAAAVIGKPRRDEADDRARAAEARVRSEAAAAKAAEVADARTAERAEAQAAKRAARQATRDAKAAERAGSQLAKRAANQEARDAKAAERASRRDRIVEAPREPKKSVGQRLRRNASTTGEPSRPRGRRVLSAVAGLIGAIGLACSIVLAVGALLVALDTNESGSFYTTIENICDVLVGPLRDVFTFSGANGDMKESLVAWGVGSIGYLVIGFIAQSVLRSAAED